MRKTKKSTKLSTKHGVDRYHSRIKNIGDIDSKLKHIKKVGHSMDCYFGDFYKYLYGKNAKSNNLIVFEDNLYIFDRTFNFLITTYPVPKKFIPTRKYFLSTTKKNIIDNIADYINKIIVINYFNKKVTSKLLDMEIMFNNAYFTAITANGELLKFSFDDIYDFVLSKNPQAYKYSFRNQNINEALASFYLKKDVLIYLNGRCVKAKILNMLKINNEIWFRIKENNSVSFINSLDIDNIKVYTPDANNISDSKKDKNLYLLKEKYYKYVINLNEIETLIKNFKYVAEHFNIYDLKNQNIIHSTLGSGKISVFICDTVIVDFDNGESESFVFPNCFENNLLKLSNLNAHNQISNAKIENYVFSFKAEKTELENSLLSIKPQIKLEEINFELTRVKTADEIDCLIDEKEKVAKEIYKNDIGAKKNSNKKIINPIVNQIENLKFKNLQEPFIDLFLNKDVIIFCKERKFKAKILNKLYINKDLWIRVKKSSTIEFIKVSDIYDIRLSINFTEKDVIYSRLERLNNLKRKINSTTILVCELETLVKNINTLANSLNILGVKNIAVNFPSLGRGNLSNFIENKIIVDFDNGANKIFTFPYCFYSGILTLNINTKKSKITEEKIEDSKNSYLQELEFHKKVLELTKIKYKLEEINIALSNCEDGMFEKLMKKKYALEKQYYKEKLIK